MGSFNIKMGALDKLVDDIVSEEKNIDKLIYDRLSDIIKVVYKTATSKRPKIASTKDNKGKYRVSDPNAAVGVPVDTGRLQASIKQEVARKGEKFVGRIWTDLDYAPHVEFGTSKMAPRSFLRSAMHVNEDWIKRHFKGE